MGAVLYEIFTIFAVVASVVMCAVVLYFLVAGRHDRDKEEAAREYFDQHGHWPDEA